MTDQFHCFYQKFPIMSISGKINYMLDFSEEKQIFEQGLMFVGGIDEVGRGPLAGPVVASCVVCGADFKIPDELVGVKDSKFLSEKKRENFYEIIMEIFPAVGIGICDNFTIDRMNILQASFLAMRKAIGMLKDEPDYVLVDGHMPIPNMCLRQKAIVKGDSTVFLIAAASIVAKVARDKMMREYHEQCPQYNFLKNKGYGTKEHFQCLEKHGPCQIHRYSFEPVRRFKRR
jgi:ribonuclease HII